MFLGRRELAAHVAVNQIIFGRPYLLEYFAVIKEHLLKGRLFLLRQVAEQVAVDSLFQRVCLHCSPPLGYIAPRLLQGGLPPTALSDFEKLLVRGARQLFVTERARRPSRAEQAVETSWIKFN